MLPAGCSFASSVWSGESRSSAVILPGAGSSHRGPRNALHNAIPAANTYALRPKEGREAFRVARNRIFATRPMNVQSIGLELDAVIGSIAEQAGRHESEAPWVQ